MYPNRNLILTEVSGLEWPASGLSIDVSVFLKHVQPFPVLHDALQMASYRPCLHDTCEGRGFDLQHV